MYEEPILSLLPLKEKVASLQLATKFSMVELKIPYSVIEAKVAEYDAEVISKVVLGDDHEKITAAILANRTWCGGSAAPVV